MKTSTAINTDLLETCLLERELAADELQNEINQLLASVLLWIRFAKTENNLTSDLSVINAERNLQEAIERVRTLHYSFSKILCNPAAQKHAVLHFPLP